MVDSDPSDLSAGTLPAKQGESVNIRLQLDRQRLQHRSWLFITGVTASLALLAVYLCFACRIIANVLSANFTIGWPAFALGSITLASSVALLLGLARYTFQTAPPPPHETPDPEIPQVNCFREAMELVKALNGNTSPN
ncbi:hypothetical protein ACW73L_16010 [Methylolobus aquaticus]